MFSGLYRSQSSILVSFTYYKQGRNKTYDFPIKVSETAKGKTQTQLAEKPDVFRQSISKWERNQSIPKLEKIVASMRFLTLPLTTC